MQLSMRELFWTTARHAFAGRSAGPRAATSPPTLARTVVPCPGGQRPIAVLPTTASTRRKNTLPVQAFTPRRLQQMLASSLSIIAAPCMWTQPKTPSSLASAGRVCAALHIIWLRFPTTVAPLLTLLDSCCQTNFAVRSSSLLRAPLLSSRHIVRAPT
jgi:hypothetical protein